jgi:predicted RNA-binding protein YlxR (DUF448 family)
VLEQAREVPNYLVVRNRHIPLRSCAACGQRSPKRELVRIVRTQDGAVEVDPTGKKAGRGGYLCPKADCWKLGLAKSRLEHVLRSPLLERDREALSHYYHERLKPTGVGELR